MVHAFCCFPGCFCRFCFDRKPPRTEFVELWLENNGIELNDSNV